METAGRELKDEAEREAMKDSGIGTPATRAAIIETLVARDYIRREKKSLVPTDKGLAVYGIVKDRKIADVAMTGGWELALSKIATGEMDATTFHCGIEVYAAQIAKELLEVKIESAARHDAVCPRCGEAMTFYPKVAKCRNAGCGLTVWRTVARKETDGCPAHRPRDKRQNLGHQRIYQEQRRDVRGGGHTRQRV